MDMDMPPVDPTVVNLPLSDPRCNSADCMAFADAAAESSAKHPWTEQFKYGHWATYYYLAIIGVFIFAYIYRTYHDRKATVTKTNATHSPTVGNKILAGGRWLAYRRISFPGSTMFEIPSFGVLALLLASIVFLAACTFATRPYYRQHYHYGSPPIATRTGLMAYACTPIMIALAGKANVVTLITGISHEKLNVLHRWVGWFTLVLSLIHTIPFFYQPGHDRGYTTLKAEWSVRMGGDMYSGVPPLAMLVGLTFLSIPPIRRWAYETFYYSHVLIAISYLGLLFWHAANLEDSWAYLWATLSLWLASWLARLFWYTRPLNLRNEWFQGATTLLTQLPGGMTKIEVTNPPDDFVWTPSQHCFLRFPSISLLDNHPFTIVSGPPATSSRRRHNVQDEEKNNGFPRKLTPLSFLARTHSGFTRRLDTYVSKNADTPLEAWIDGPYGGLGRPIERLYDNLVLFAGGSGITVCLPFLTSILEADPSEIRVGRITLIWAVKHKDHLEWARDILAGVNRRLAQRGEGPRSLDVALKFYVTQEDVVERDAPTTTTTLHSHNKQSPKPELTSHDKEIHADSTDKIHDMSSSSSPVSSNTSDHSPSSTPLKPTSPISDLGTLHHGRPDIASLVQEELSTPTPPLPTTSTTPISTPQSNQQQKTFFLGCGPDGMRNELGNSVAQAQSWVLRGRAVEVALHLEAFGW